MASKKAERQLAAIEEKRKQKATAAGRQRDFLAGERASRDSALRARLQKIKDDMLRRD